MIKTPLFEPPKRLTSAAVLVAVSTLEVVALWRLGGGFLSVEWLLWRGVAVLVLVEGSLCGLVS